MPQLTKRTSYYTLLLPAFIIYIAVIIFPTSLSYSSNTPKRNKYSSST